MGVIISVAGQGLVWFLLVAVCVAVFRVAFGRRGR